MATKVLVVDDSSMSRQAVKRALTPAGFDVVEAVDGLDALGKLRDLRDVALVVCDVNMPRMNGLEFLQTLRDDQDIGEVAVVVMSAAGTADPLHRARAFGAKGWIKKPIDAALMVATALKITSAA